MAGPSDVVVVRTPKGKGREAAKWMRGGPPAHYSLVENDGRCGDCKRQGTACWVDITQLVKWREEMEAGGPSGRALFTCHACSKRKKKCEFPLSAKAAGAGKKEKGKAKAKAKSKEGSVTPSTTSSKQKREAMVAVELPAPKRARVAAGPAAADEALVILFQRIEERIGEVADAASEVAQEVRLARREQAQRDRVLSDLLALLVKAAAPFEAVAVTGEGSGVAAAAGITDEEVEIEIEDMRVEGEVGAEVAGAGSEEGSEEKSDEVEVIE